MKTVCLWLFFCANFPENIDRRYISTEAGITGKGNNFWNLFEAVVELGAEGTAQGAAAGNIEITVTVQPVGEGFVCE